MQSELELSRPDKTPITCWEEWTPPKKEYQWVLGRSAMELAKAWFAGGRLSPPQELIKLLDSHPRLHNLKLIRGIPECVTILPVKGEGRNHDLWLIGRTEHDSVTICIEAKADEPFGNETVAEYRATALRRREKRERTGVPERINALLKLVAGSASYWDPIRYQLLTAMCGTVLQAKKDSSSLAVFVVHEFRTEKTKPENLERNNEDYERFLTVIGIPSSSAMNGCLQGPVMIDGVECLVGKAVTTMKTTADAFDSTSANASLRADALREEVTMGKYVIGDFVKAEFKDDASGESEWMWVMVHSSDDEKRVVFGRLDNEPVVFKRLRLGQEIAVSYDLIREHRSAASS